MSDTPDLSKIVSLIMENPSLIAEISALVKNDAEKTEPEAPVAVSVEEHAESAPASITPATSKSEKRKHLLYAMKPYLKDERSRAIDSMMSIVEILDMVRSK